MSVEQIAVTRIDVGIRLYYSAPKNRLGWDNLPHAVRSVDVRRLLKEEVLGA